MNTSRQNHRPCTGVSRAGWTLTDLVMLLAALLLIGLAIKFFYAPPNGRRIAHAKAIQCTSNVKQLTVGWMSYPVDNGDKLMPNPGWAAGMMNWDPANTDNTNSDLLLDSSRSGMADYVKNPAPYKCPADDLRPATFTRNRVRSYSLNAALAGERGSGPTVQGTSPQGRTYFGKSRSGPTGAARKAKDLEPVPSRIFVMLEEHPDSLNDATFMLDPGYERGSERWRDLPGSQHNGGASIAFADGHAEIHKWEETGGANTTLYPVTYTATLPWTARPVGTSKDYEWLQDGMPWR